MLPSNLLNASSAFSRRLKAKPMSAVIGEHDHDAQYSTHRARVVLEFKEVAEQRRRDGDEAAEERLPRVDEPTHDPYRLPRMSENTAQNDDWTGGVEPRGRSNE